MSMEPAISEAGALEKSAVRKPLYVKDCREQL
jgi:hypothetical protein